MKEPRRKHIKIDWNFVKLRLTEHATGKQIAEEIGCSDDLLFLRCKEELGMALSDLKQECRKEGKARLTSKMYDVGIKQGNPALLIWLSKNWLGYTDKIEQKIDVKEWKVGFDSDEKEDDGDDNDSLETYQD